MHKMHLLHFITIGIRFLAGDFERSFVKKIFLVFLEQNLDFLSIFQKNIEKYQN